MSLEITVNGTVAKLDVPSDTPLLWVIREEIGLKGTKFGCGMGLCGACTVHLGNTAVRSCITPVEAAVGTPVTTIEGLASEAQAAPAKNGTQTAKGLGADSDGLMGGHPELHPLQRAWITHSVPQCGYCQSGQIMAAASLLASNPNPTDEEIKTHMAGNICRCGTYSAINVAIKDAARALAPLQPMQPLQPGTQPNDEKSGGQK